MPETNGSPSQTSDRPTSAATQSAQRTRAKRRPPIIYSTLCVELIKRLAVLHYGFDESVECTFFCRGVSDTYLLSTTDRKFALKVYRSNWRTQQAILGELAAIRHVGGKGIEVALPVPRTDGSWITGIEAPEGSRSAVLFAWACGRAPKYTDATHAAQYGRLVGRLHAAGDDLPADGARPQMDIAYLFERPLQRIRPQLRHLPSVAAGLEALVERTRPRLDSAARHLCDWGFCHGDIWANNARIEGAHLVLFDFDFCGSGWQLFDLASYRWHARFEGLEEPAWGPFIDAYLQVRPAAAASLEFIGLFMILKQLWTTAHFVGRLPETGAYFLSDEYLENMVPFCERIESEIVKHRQCI